MSLSKQALVRPFLAVFSILVTIAKNVKDVMSKIPASAIVSMALLLAGIKILANIFVRIRETSMVQSVPDAVSVVRDAITSVSGDVKNPMIQQVVMVVVTWKTVEFVSADALRINMNYWKIVVLQRTNAATNVQGLL